MLIQHSAIYILARLLPGALSMVTTAILTRLLIPEAYGQYGLALIVMAFGSNFFFDWLGVTFVRLYEARRGDPRTMSTFIQINFVIILITLVLGLVAWGAGAFEGHGLMIYAIGLCLMWIFAWFELVARIEVANFRPQTYMIMNLGRAALILVGSCGGAWLTRGPVGTAVGYGVGMLVASLFGASQRWNLRPRSFDPKLAARILRFGLPVALSMSLGGISTSGTRWLVEALDSAEALGLYTAAYVLVLNTLNVIAYGVAAAAFPLAVRAVEAGDPAVARRQLSANASLLFAVIAPASLGMAMTADGLAGMLVGAQYVTEVARLTPWLAAGSFLISFRAHYLDHGFQLANRAYHQVWISAVTALVACAASIVLIPREGPMGVAIATTFAWGLSCVLALVAGRSAYPLPMPWGSFARVLAACGAMAAVLFSIPGRSLLSLMAQVCLGAVAYAAVALALNVVGLRTPARTLLRVGLLRAGALVGRA